RETLEAVDDVLYRSEGSYRSDGHNRAGLFEWEEIALRQYFGSARRLLLIAAGGGREAIALAKRGYEVEAYECNPALVETAARVISSIPEVGSLRVLPLPKGAPPPPGPRCDGCVVGWSAYMLIPGSE